MDLVIKNGRTLNGNKIEIGIFQGKIAFIGEHCTQVGDKEIDLQGKKYVSPGWIDAHVHCYDEMDLYYDHPDKIGVVKGVTTVIDAGSTGFENIGAFQKLVKHSKTNVYAMLNISKSGIVTQDELADLTKIQSHLIKETIVKYPDFIVGIKARLSKTVVGESGVKPLFLAKEIQRENGGLPLMVHIGSAPPTLAEILALLESKDMVTHCFHGKANGILDRETDEIRDFVFEAYGRGVCFDVGHGTDSFNFHVAQKAIEAGLKSTTISTDIYHRNRTRGPVYDLATTLEKMLVMGYSLSEVIHQVTEAPAKHFSLQTKGELKVGFDGDLTIFEVVEGKKLLTDSQGQMRVAHQLIRPVQVVVGGFVYDCE